MKYKIVTIITVALLYSCNTTSKKEKNKEIFNNQKEERVIKISPKRPSRSIDSDGSI